MIDREESKEQSASGGDEAQEETIEVTFAAYCKEDFTEIIQQYSSGIK